jgi:hypothetical protein
LSIAFHYFSKLFHIYVTLAFNRDRKYLVLRNSEIPTINKRGKPKEKQCSDKDITIKTGGKVTRGEPYREGVFRVEVDDESIALSVTDVIDDELLQVQRLLGDCKDLRIRTCVK